MNPKPACSHPASSPESGVRPPAPPARTRPLALFLACHTALIATGPALASAYQPFTFFSKADEVKSRGVVGIRFNKGYAPPTQSVPDRWVRPGSLPVRPGSVFVVVAEYNTTPNFAQGKNFSFGWRATQTLPIDPLTGYQIQPVFATNRPVDSPQSPKPQVILLDNKSRVSGDAKQHYAWFEVPANVPNGTTFELWLADPSGDSIDGLPITLEGPRLSIVVNTDAQADASSAAAATTASGTPESATVRPRVQPVQPVQPVQQQTMVTLGTPSSLIIAAPLPTPLPPPPPPSFAPLIPPTQSVPDRVAPKGSSVIISGQDMVLVYNTKCYDVATPPCDPAAVTLQWVASSATRLPCNSSGVVYAAKGAGQQTLRIPTNIPISAQSTVQIDLYWMGNPPVKAAQPATFVVQPKSSDSVQAGEGSAPATSSTTSAQGAADATGSRTAPENRGTQEPPLKENEPFRTQSVPDRFEPVIRKPHRVPGGQPLPMLYTIRNSGGGPWPSNVLLQWTLVKGDPKLLPTTAGQVQAFTTLNDQRFEVATNGSVTAPTPMLFRLSDFDENDANELVQYEIVPRATGIPANATILHAVECDPSSPSPQVQSPIPTDFAKVGPAAVLAGSQVGFSFRSNQFAAGELGVRITCFPVGTDRPAVVESCFAVTARDIGTLRSQYFQISTSGANAQDQTVRVELLGKPRIGPIVTKTVTMTVSAKAAPVDPAVR